ncbi:hypothetical protein [Paraburkholderia elongata]|uniref:hypothetical protein n=1 Tax=Paraburkholderia elongata TaxID=2675747 RepID=UPI0015537360|nr:hypothetical protein [Paraburkholderia elongata]
MLYLIALLAGAILGIFACTLLCGVFLAFRPTPPTLYGRRKPAPPEVAQMPVVEAGCVAYQFLGVTGEEQ